jgi:hypothetical protein
VSMYTQDSFELSVPPDETVRLIKQRVGLGQGLLDHAGSRFPAPRMARLIEFRHELDRWRGEKTALIDSLLYEPPPAAPSAPEA